MTRAVILVAVAALLVAFPGCTGAEDEDESRPTTMVGNTASTEHYVEDDDDDGFLETESSRDDGSFGSKISPEKRIDENIPKPSPLLADSSGYRMPGLFGFNGGEPFYLEKDPITGEIDFSTKTSPVKYEDPETGPSIRNHKLPEGAGNSDDYYYDEEEEDGDNIDRKDSGRPPTINEVSNKYKNENKFPLISSSYANTKVQGTASDINRNHRPYTTSSTQSPLYYSIRPQPTFVASTYHPPTRGTTRYRPTTIVVTTPRPTEPPVKTGPQQFDYEEEEDYDTEAPTGFSLSELFGYGKPSTKTEKPTHKPEVTTVRLTTARQEVTTSKPLPTQTPGIIYSEPSPLPSSTTSIPVSSTQFISSQRPPDIIIPDLQSNPSEKIKTSVTPVASHHPKPPPHFSPPPTFQNPEKFGSNVVKNNPYGTFAEEPFRPIFGPGEVESRPPLRGPEQQPLISTPNKNVISAIVPNSNVVLVPKPDNKLPPKIPPETPTRWNYPYNEGTSNFFKLPNTHHHHHNQQQHQQNLAGPPRIPGVEPPRPHPATPPFLKLAETPVHTSETSVSVVNDLQRPAPSQIQVAFKPEVSPNKKIDVEGQVVFPNPTASVSVSANMATAAKDDGNIRHPPQEVVSQQTPTQPGPQLPPRDDVEEPAQDLRPPAEPVTTNYPRPHWESRPPQFHPPNDPSQVARPKHDTVPPNFSNGYRARPGYPSENPQNRPKIRNQDSNLPNILPQFRPNAKISHVHLDNGGRIQSYYLGPQRQPLLDRPNRRPPPEFMGHLHPPPPPNHRRVNRNDAPEEVFPFEKYPPQPPNRPLVHRRTGPHVTEVRPPRPQVSTLQMMQQGYISRPQSARDDFPDESKPPVQVKYPMGSQLDAEASEKQPVFVVYPVNSSPLNTGGVVMGTRGSQRPVPPSNLDSDSGIFSDVGPLALPLPGHNKDQKPLLQLATDRLDTSTATNVGKPVKSDFPYPLERPESEEDVKEGDTDLKERLDDVSIMNDDILAEVHDSHVDKHDEDDTEINIIPYLQDYMPFATKKPITSLKPSSPTTISSTNSIITIQDTKKPEITDNQWTTISLGPHTQEARIVNAVVSANDILGSTPVPQKSSSPISVTLRTVQPSTTNFPKSSPIANTRPSQSGVIGSGGSEITVSAVMHTHPQSLSNHRPAELLTSTVPPQLNFQAPFLASANIGPAPSNQGWSVVDNGGGPSNERMKPGTVDKADLHVDESSVGDVKVSGEHNGNEPPNFDFENFRPQLFGGFKPIYKFPEESGEEQNKFLQTTERQEKMIF